MAMESFRKMSSSEEVHFLVEQREKAKRDYNHFLHEARREGQEEGRAEGKAEGKIEGKIEAARKLLAEGMKREDIARILNLSCGDF
ncbi:MAG: hypothetical protein RDV48_28010 [Candidatus Eremiobacteraeota bacterium]|nr:hypothetical protein [Candidatus Eremiobacteraeota bacterium]